MVEEKPKPKRKPRASTKSNTTVVDVVPIDTPSVEAKEPEVYNDVAVEEPRVQDIDVNVNSRIA